MIGWVIFRSENLSYTLDYVRNMFGTLKNVTAIYDLDYYINNVEIIAFILAALCSLPIFKNCVYAPKNKLAHIGLNIWIIALFLLSVSSIAASTYNPFIYFRF